MFADNRFGYLDKVRYGLGYGAAPIYWVADVPTRVSLWIDDVFVSRTDLLEENEQLREQLLFSQRELQLLESLASENSRLLALNEATQTIDGVVLPAEIINVSPDPNSKRVLINKGARAVAHPEAGGRDGEVVAVGGAGEVFGVVGIDAVVGSTFPGAIQFIQDSFF